MAVVGDVGNAKGMKDAKKPVYIRDVGFAIDRNVARDMKHAGRVEQAKMFGYNRDAVRRRMLGGCDSTKSRGTLETSEKSENVAYDAIDSRATRTTDRGHKGNAPTHNLQAIGTARVTCYRPLTSHDDYADSTEAVADGTAHNNVKLANTADDVAVQTMRSHELLK